MVAEANFNHIIGMITQVQAALAQQEKRFAQIEKRFDQVDRRFDQVDKRFDKIEEEIRDIKNTLRHHDERINALYESRDHITVRFGRTWAFASFFMAVLAATITIAFEKAFS